MPSPRPPREPSGATYDLRRLRLRGLIEPIPRSHRYRVTEQGLRIARCYHNVCSVARCVQRCPRSSTRTSFQPSADSSDPEFATRS